MTRRDEYLPKTTLQQHIMVLPDRFTLEHNVRGAKKWKFERLEKLDDMLEIQVLKTSMTLQETYRMVKF